MAKVTATPHSITVEISDPVELERLMVVLHRTKSTKVIALREAMIAALNEAHAEELVTDEVVENVITNLEKLLEQE